jgi:hypothetical protein
MCQTLMITCTITRNILKVCIHNESSTEQPYISVEAEHENTTDEVDKHGGLMAHKFTRRYVLPSDVQVTQLTCTRSHCGVLTIEANHQRADDGVGARWSTKIPITIINKVERQENGERNVH